MITITRTDRAYCRKWTQAHRKGKPTAEITREWLAKVGAPKSAPTLERFAGGCATMVLENFISPLSDYAKRRVGLSTDDEGYAYYERRDWRDEE